MRQDVESLIMYTLMEEVEIETHTEPSFIGMMVMATCFLRMLLHRVDTLDKKSSTPLVQDSMKERYLHQ